MNIMRESKEKPLQLSSKISSNAESFIAFETILFLVLFKFAYINDEDKTRKRTINDISAFILTC